MDAISKPAAPQITPEQLTVLFAQIPSSGTTTPQATGAVTQEAGPLQHPTPATAQAPGTIAAGAKAVAMSGPLSSASLTQLPKETHSSGVDLHQLEKALTQSPRPGLAKPAAALLTSVGTRENVGDQAKAGNSQASTSTSSPKSISNLSIAGLTTLSLFLGGKSNKATQESMINRMNNISNQTRAASNEQQQKLNDSYSQMGSASKAGKWGKVFGWAAAIVGVVVAVAATIMTGGAAWPLLVASCIGLGIMIDSSTGSHVMNFITDALTKVADIVVKFGASALSALTGGAVDISDSTQEKIGKILGVLITAALIVTTMVILSLCGDPEAAAKMGVEKALKIVKRSGAIIAGAATVAGGAAGIASTVYTYQGQNSQIMAKEWSALIEALRQFSKQSNTVLKALIQSMSEQTTTAFKITEALAQTGSTIYGNVAHSA